MNKIIDGYVINLEHCSDRREHILNEFQDTCINISLFNAIKHEKGWIGCLKSHLNLIKYAKENNMNMILVIEDDAYIEDKEHFNKIFPQILDYLKNNLDEWKIFHGGPNINKHSVISNIYSNEPLLFNISKCVSATFIIYNINSYDDFLHYLDIEERQLKSSHKIDMLIYNKFNCITTFPCLIWQINSYSDIYNSYRDDLENIKKYRDINFKRKLKHIY